MKIVLDRIKACQLD